MAKEGKRVTKGFGFYLLMFILLLVAAFMIIVCVMMFCPRKVILGYQYFNNNEQKTLTTTTDESQTAFDFSSLSKIVVSAETSQVSIVRSDVTSEQIVFVDKSMGFAKWDDRTVSEYSVTQSGNTLNVNVVEPQGFLHFAYDLQVIIRVPYDKYDFSSTSFDITTTSGSVIVGNSAAVQNKNVVINPYSLTISTGSGNINLTEFVDSEFDTLKLSTGSGVIRTGLNSITATFLMSLQTQSGHIQINSATRQKNEDGTLIPNTVNARNGLFLNVHDGQFSADNIIGSVSLITHNGAINIDKIQGSFDTNSSIEVIDSANITVGSVSGDVSLPNVKASNVNIQNIGGQVNIQTTSGNVTIGDEENGLTDASYIKSESGTIVANVKDSKVGSGVKHYFLTESGEIKLNYIDEIYSNNILSSESGAITANVGSQYKFTLHCKDATGEYKEYNNLTLTFISSTQYQKSAFNVNNYTGSTNILDLSTNGHITVDLLRIS